MGAGPGLIVPLAEAGRYSAAFIGGKGHTLGRLLKAGYPVPRGFCIQVEAYQEFVAVTGLRATIAMELERKAFADRLKAAGFETTLRYSLGSDIAAACGQLVQHKIRQEDV